MVSRSRANSSPYFLVRSLVSIMGLSWDSHGRAGGVSPLILQMLTSNRLAGENLTKVAIGLNARKSVASMQECQDPAGSRKHNRKRSNDPNRSGNLDIQDAK